MRFLGITAHSGNPARRVQTHRRLAMVFALIMALGSLIPAFSVGVAASPQADLPAASSQLQVTGTASLEVDLVRCPEGFDPNDLFGTCHPNGIAGVNVQIVSADSALGIDQTQATDTASGPGRASFANLPAGDYTVTVNLAPESGVRYYVYCGIAGGGDPLPPSADDALSTVVTVPDGAPVACDFYVIPTEPAEAQDIIEGEDEDVSGESTIELFGFTCPFDAFADPDVAGFAAFQQACGDLAEGVDFNLNTGELRFDETTDALGQVSFTYPVGNEVDFLAAVPLEADEYLFCILDDGQGVSLVEMDAQGVAHFDNDSAEVRTCSWFLIEDAPATEVLAEVPTQEPTAEPAVEPTGESIAPPSTLGEISVFASSCPVGYDPETQGVDEDALSANCAQGVENVSFTFGYENGDEDVRLADGQNPIVFTELDPGTYTLYSDVPLEAADEYVFCTADGGNRYEKDLNDRGMTTFGELESEQIACEWYIVPTSQRGDETGGSLEIHLAVCPIGYTGDSIFDDCHGEGLADYEFSLAGPDGTQTGTTELPQTPGPGVVLFTGLAAGDYTFNGGPPGDFGSVELFCSTQPDNGTPDFGLDGGITGTLTLGENQHVLCDWYFIPEDASGQTPTPMPTQTPEPERAEILVTLYACPPAASQSGTYGGASLETFTEACGETVDNVTFRLGDPNSAPLSARTGVSGDGAVRFFDLLPGDLTMTPSLPSGLTSAAVFCTIDDRSVYQKALSNGGTTFVDVNGQSIECSWFAVRDRVEPVAGPSGSITIREYLCEDDRAEITDWDAECAPGSTGTSYTIANTSTAAPAEGTPDDDGVYVFAGLANGFYTLEQNTGAWCRAVADRVDSESRVIVEGGGNTDVVLYQCNAVEGLPDTGTGPGGTIVSDRTELTGMRLLAIALMLIALPLAWSGWVQMRKRRDESLATPPVARSEPRISANGRVQMRFR